MNKYKRRARIENILGAIAFMLVMLFAAKLIIYGPF